MTDYPRKAESAVPSATPQNAPKGEMESNSLKESLDTNPRECSAPQSAAAKS